MAKTDKLPEKALAANTPASPEVLPVFDRIRNISTNHFLEGDLLSVAKSLPGRIDRKGLSASFDLEIPVGTDISSFLGNVQKELRPTHGTVYHYSPFGGFVDQSLNKPYSIFVDGIYLTIQTAQEVYGRELLNRVNDILTLTNVPSERAR